MMFQKDYTFVVVLDGLSFIKIYHTINCQEANMDIITATFSEEVPEALAWDKMQHLLFNHNVSLSQCPELTLSHQRNLINLSYTLQC